MYTYISTNAGDRVDVQSPIRTAERDLVPQLHTQVSPPALFGLFRILVPLLVPLFAFFVPFGILVPVSRAFVPVFASLVPVFAACSSGRNRLLDEATKDGLHHDFYIFADDDITLLCVRA